MKRALAALLIFLAFTSATLAGDAAERRIIGFSPDAKWFAFEQFGVQDGSGFPYHDVFVIDLVNDRWAKGTPVRVRIDKETATQHQARNQARQKAAPVLAKLKIIDQGRILVSNPVTEAAVDTREVVFQSHANLTGAEHRFQINLEEFDAEADPLCKDLDVETKAFALTMSKAGQSATEVYRDAKLPKSRGCPARYGIADVIAPNVYPLPNRYVVLVHVFSYGFEGPDARFIALPVTAP